jgi:hypothetical protein
MKKRGLLKNQRSSRSVQLADPRSASQRLNNVNVFNKLTGAKLAILSTA